jgi:tripartite-type tricarboxylate transporter receptor subunit TctC
LKNYNWKLYTLRRADMKRTRDLLTLFVVVIILVATPLADTVFSQSSYPDRPITMIMWSTAGMGDVIRRAACAEAEKQLGQPIVIEYKTGASGTIEMAYIAKSKPDGYTLGGAVTSMLWIAPHMRHLTYNTLTDFTDIITVAMFNFGLAVRSDAPWNSYEELIAYARKNPGKIRYTTVGVGVTQHICMERIAAKEGIKWTLVPFKSIGECIIALLGGHVDAIAQGSVDIIPQLKAGKMKLLLVLNDSRWQAAPDIPQIREKGYNFAADSHISFLGPKGIPEPIRQKLEDAFREGMKSPSYTQLLEKFGVERSELGGKEYSALWKSQYEEMGKVIKSLGLGENK